MKKALALIPLTLCMAAMSGCSSLYTNDRTRVSLMTVEVREEGVCFSVGDYYNEKKMLVYDSASGEMRWGEGALETNLPEVVLEGASTAYGLQPVAAEGYEPLLEQIFQFAVDPDKPIVNALAYKAEDTVYGFCNLYSGTGFFSGASIDEGCIERALLFTYDEETEALSVVEEFEKCIVVAYDGTGVIWYDHQTYYGKPMGGEAAEICKDMAFDKGPTNWSNARFYFGGGYCILDFHHEGTNRKEYDIYVLVTMSGEKLAEFKQITAEIR